MQGTLNRVKEGSKGTERMQENMEQSPVRLPGNSDGCARNTEESKGRIKGNRKDAREHRTKSSKVAREQ